MPLVHCNKCQHEWECTGEDDRECEWCGGGSYILESEAPIYVNIDDILTNLKKLNNPLADKVIKKIIKKK